MVGLCQSALAKFKWMTQLRPMRDQKMFAAALEEKLLLNLENQPQRWFFLFTEQSHGKGKIHKVIESLWNHEVQLLE